MSLHCICAIKENRLKIPRQPAQMMVSYCGGIKVPKWPQSAPQKERFSLTQARRKPQENFVL